VKTPSISGRLVRSSLRYLRDREGAAAIAQVARELPAAPFVTAAGGDDGRPQPAQPRAQSAAKDAQPGAQAAAKDWIGLPDWLAFLGAVERRYGDPETLRLLREMTRATMAAALSTVWGTHLHGASPFQLLDRAGDFWSLSFDTGRLVVVERGAGRARLAVEGWDDPPREVGVIVAEACAVFLARLGFAAPRVVADVVNRRLEIVGAW
jgi:hypothetical protein